MPRLRMATMDFPSPQIVGSACQMERRSHVTITIRYAAARYTP